MGRMGRLIGSLRVLALLAAGVLCGGSDAAAQGVGVLAGRVTEAGSGEPLGSVVVRVEGPRMAEVVAAADGTWRLGPLPPGPYVVRVEHLGYADAEWEVVLDPGGSVWVEVELTPRPISLDAVVVTASRRSQALKDVPVATELLTRAEVEQSGAADLSSVLVERTGIQLEGGHPNGAGVMLQGLGSERVLVLLDGQPFIGRLSGGIDLSRIPTSMIERVEVVKGPHSTLYGSEAMGGVVNVITRAPDRGTWSVGGALTGGSQGRLDVAANALGGFGSIAWLADVGRRSARLTPGQAEEEGALAERWDALAKVQWLADSAFSADAAVLFLDERQRWRAGQLYYFADNRQVEARAGARWTMDSHHLSSLVHATEFRHLARRATTPEPVEGTGEEETQRRFELELLYGGSLAGHALDLGLEAHREEIRSARVSGRERAVHTLEPFAQVTLSGERWSVAPGARFSWSEQWGTHWTPRLAVMARPLPALAVRGSVGRGYRAPSFKELHMEFLNIGPGYGYAVKGNPTLRPETSTNVTVGAEWSGDRLYLRGQLFHNTFDDFIETRITGDSSGIEIHSYQNIESGTTRGLELEAGATWRGLRAEAGYAWLQAYQDDADTPILGRPAHSVRAMVSYALSMGLRASVSAHYTGATPVQRTDDGIRERDGFLRFDARVAQRLPHGFQLVIGADNIFDAVPRDWPGNARRHLYAALSWTAVGER